jgi:hypothetical protein
MILLHGAPALSGGSIFVMVLIMLLLFCLSIALTFVLPLQLAKRLPKYHAIIGNIGIAALYNFIAFQLGVSLQIAWLAGLPALIIALAIALSPKGN